MKDVLKQRIIDTIPVTEEELNLIDSFFKPLTVQKNESLLENGQVADRLFFISKGCLRLYYNTDDYHGSTRFMAFEHTFLTSLVSFISREPAPENIQAVEKSELLFISHKDFFYLKKTIPAWEKFYIYILEYGLTVITARLNSLLTQNASERYKTLLKNNPELIQRLSNSNLAAYLNISPETLSRLKSAI